MTTVGISSSAFLLCTALVSACATSMHFISPRARVVEGVHVNHSVDDATAKELLAFVRACSDLGCVTPSDVEAIRHMKGFTDIRAITIRRDPSSSPLTFMVYISPYDHENLTLYIQRDQLRQRAFHVVDISYGQLD